MSTQPTAGTPGNSQTIRKFDTGATRDQDVTKFDFEGFLSPIVLERFGEFMHAHRKQADGQLRDSDNWQKGIPLAAYMKSLIRHGFDVWKAHRGYKTTNPTGLEDALCALIFNAMGYLFELLKKRGYMSVEYTQSTVSIPSTAPALDSTHGFLCSTAFCRPPNAPVSPKAQPPLASKAPVAEKVKNIISEHLGDDNVNYDSRFVEDLGADSLDEVELLMAVEESFNIEISDLEAEKMKTVGDLVLYVQAKV